MTFHFKPFFQALIYSFRGAALKQLPVMAGIWMFFLPWLIINNTALLLDHILFPWFKKVPVRKPVFIIGNARSGTTFFHRLLCNDVHRFTYFKTYEVFFPSLLARMVILIFADVFHRMSKGKIAGWFQGKETEFFSWVNHIHKVSLNQAEEDEALFFQPFFSIDLHFLFPFLSKMEDMNQFDTLAERDRERLLSHYEQCLKRHMAIHGENKIFLSKNPNATSKLRALYSHFPDSRFILLVRNPLEQIPSTLDLFGTVWNNLSVPQAGDSLEFRRLYEVNVDMYRHVLKNMPGIDPSRIVIVHYEELVKDPEAAVRRVYRHFGMDLDNDFARILASEKKRHSTYKSRHKYCLETYGLSPEMIFRDLGDVFNTYGFRR